MSKNLTRKGLALGALVGLVSTAVAGTPAFAADEVTFALSSGTVYAAPVNDTLTLNASLVSSVPAANIAQLKFKLVTDGTFTAKAVVTTGSATPAAAKYTNAATGGATTGVGIGTMAAAVASTGRNAEIRKNVLKYDDVMSRQREAIYTDRRHILEGDDIQNRISGFLEDVIKDVVNQHIVEGTGKDWDLDALWSDLKTIYPIGLEISEVLAEAGNRSRLTRDWLTRELVSDAKVAYAKRNDEIGDAAMRELERRVVLSVVDRKWRDHLYEMDYLKEGIGLRAMAQRDPLVEYQREGYGMFQQMMGAIREESVGFMFNIEVQVQAAAPVIELKPDAKKLTYTSPSEDGSAEIHEGGSDGPVKPTNGSKKPDGKSAPGSSFFKN